MNKILLLLLGGIGLYFVYVVGIEEPLNTFVNIISSFTIGWTLSELLFGN